MFSKAIFAAAALFSAIADAHIIMTSPIPYANTTLNNSPLDASGSDFPCKIRSDMWANQEALLKLNTFEIGQNHTLAFEGIATHGGGSCQISLSTDLEPTKDSKWMVIHSIEGGCPINTAGNLDDGGATTPVPNTFQFSIPDGISAGKYALAWTWFNRVGNREMYMNCAPITVTGGSQKRDEPSSKAISKRDSFPSMFVANINGCTTPENVDIRFPDPGDSVVYAGEPSNLQAVGQAACTGGPGPGPSGSSGSSPSTVSPTASPATSSLAASSATSAASESSVTSAPESTPTGAPGIFASGASPIASQTATVSVVAASPSSSSSSSSGALSGSCSPEGTWNCINGSSFQRCASGNWSSPIDMASGTTCTAGKSDSLKVAAVKRSPRVPAGHLHARRHINRASHI
ncbi:CAZyme family AA11 [Paecilomyces variotii]|nr:CAZyme family AA11 [Paecilomyces variotii]KAJ9207262.1 CAZyme family AA11 [Paecilomyces variotii]KAJ9281098.1 CAZyme family AA11 [Paecilomyces variotii]KAJ9345471.1 CAZyme family AA11 [Paecilomyces variotii]KAJ9386042.1 CAZyme family AA11 [Paecilomyces variotii]